MAEKYMADVDEYGKPINHCQFGCKDDQLDDRGYCFHLVGFSNDPSKGKYQPLKPLIRKSFANGEVFDTGNKVVSGEADILPTDKIVNPEYIQIVQGAAHTAKKWHSCRIYREKPVVQKAAPKPHELDQVRPSAPAVDTRSEEPPQWVKDLVSSLKAFTQKASTAEVEKAAPPKKRTGWPKGKPRGKKKPPVEAQETEPAKVSGD